MNTQELLKEYAQFEWDWARRPRRLHCAVNSIILACLDADGISTDEQEDVEMSIIEAYRGAAVEFLLREDIECAFTPWFPAGTQWECCAGFHEDATDENPMPVIVGASRLETIDHAVLAALRELKK